MNPKIEKLAKDIEKTKAKIAEQQARLQDLEKQKTCLLYTSLGENASGTDRNGRAGELQSPGRAGKALTRAGTRCV